MLLRKTESLWSHLFYWFFSVSHKVRRSITCRNNETVVHKLKYVSFPGGNRIVSAIHEKLLSDHSQILGSLSADFLLGFYSPTRRIFRSFLIIIIIIIIIVESLNFNSWIQIVTFSLRSEQCFANKAPSTRIRFQKMKVFSFAQSFSYPSKTMYKKRLEALSTFYWRYLNL